MQPGVWWLKAVDDSDDGEVYTLNGTCVFFILSCQTAVNLVCYFFCARYNSALFLSAWCQCGRFSSVLSQLSLMQVRTSRTRFFFSPMAVDTSGSRRPEVLALGTINVIFSF